MSSYSLLKTIHGTKTESGEANAYHSSRWSDLDQNFCPKRGMYDIVGRGPLCADSLFAGSNGCVPATQRINAENDNRPKYGEYIARVGSALSGDPYESLTEKSATERDIQRKNIMMGFNNTSSAIRSTTNNSIL